MESQSCNKCKQELLLTEFYKNQVTCKTCQKQYVEDNAEKVSLYNKVYYKINLSKIRERRRKLSERDKEIPCSKICIKCNTEKPQQHFHRQAAARDGLHTYCKVCNRKDRKQWHIRKEREALRNKYK